MREFFGKIKNLSIITIISSAVMGIVLLARPGETLYVVSMICGITMIALGVGALISFFVKDRNMLLIILAVISVIMGIIVCVKYKSIVSILLFLFGLFILISGIVDLITSIDVKRYGFGDWIVSFLMSLVTAVLGLLIVVNPFSSSLAVIRLLGISLLVYAVLDLIAFIQVKKVAKAVKEAVINIEPSQIEADAKEIDE